MESSRTKVSPIVSHCYKSTNFNPTRPTSAKFRRGEYSSQRESASVLGRFPSRSGNSKSPPSTIDHRILIILRRQEDSPMRRQPSFKWAQYVKPAKSPTKPDIVESPQPSPQQPEHNIPYNRNNPQPQLQTTAATPDRPRVQVLPISDSPGSTGGQPSGQSKSSKESTDNFKSFKVSLDDPTWKVLPAALKKYRINNDNWQNYAMFICYGSAGRLPYLVCRIWSFQLCVLQVTE
jgi:hypothetical protein